MVVYGVCDIFMGVVIYVVVFFGIKKLFGWIFVVVSGVVVVDGIVCWSYGQGEWNYWGYVFMIIVVGVVLLGILDGVFVLKWN